jgi:hypothetical protein
MDKVKVAQELVAVARAMMAGPAPKFDRSVYLTGKDNLQEVDNEGAEVAIYTYDSGNGKPAAIGFKRKQSKSYFHYTFRTEDQRKEYIEKEIKENKGISDWKNERKEQRKNFKHDFKEGDILYSSWGYDQTNIDWYQVVGVTDKGIKIREIGGEDVDDSHVVPIKDHFVGPSMTKLVTPNGSIKIKSFAYAQKWDGKPKYRTPWGFGH